MASCSVDTTSIAHCPGPACTSLPECDASATDPSAIPHETCTANGPGLKNGPGNTVPSSHADHIFDSLYKRPVAGARSGPDVETKRNLGSDVGVGIDQFLGDNPVDRLPICEAQAIRDLCHPSLLSKLKHPRTGDFENARSGRAWLDDRYSLSEGGSTFRKHRNPLSAQNLYEDLKELNVQRRLIYIENLDGLYIFSLSETAVDYQVRPLREAIASHLNFRTKFSVEHSHSNPEYRISMHMTFPVTILSSSESSRPKGLPWLDTSFANLQRRRTKNIPVSGMYTARKTIEICGRTFENYIVWAFSDVLHDADPMEDKDESDFSYEAAGTSIHEDQIAFKANLDANKPIFDVRSYTLQLLACLAKESLLHWKDAIELYRDPFMVHKEHINSTSTQTEEPGQKLHNNLREANELNQKWRDLFSDLEEELSRLIDSLEEFLAQDGDIKFFYDHSSANLHRTHFGIRRTEQALKGLKDHHRTLVKWLESCDRFSDKLDQSLKLEANMRSVKTTTTTMLTVQYITPIMVTIGICSMNENLIPFSLSKISLMFVTVAVFVLFYTLQFFVLIFEANPKWWREAPGNLKMHAINSCREFQRYVRERFWASSGRGKELEAASESR